MNKMSERVTINMDISLKERIQDVSDKTDLSVSFIARKCIEMALEEVLQKFSSLEETATEPNQPLEVKINE